MSIEYDNNCFPGIVTSDETCFRFTDKSNAKSPNERLLFSNWWREQINQFGTQVSYFVNTFNTLSADNIYGEQPTKTFADPRNIVIAATLNDNAITLSQFGFQSDDDVTAYIHISSFETAFSDLTSVWSTQHDIIEPKAGDVFQLSEFGNDRPNNRQAKYFEITQKLDQDIASMNQLGGHYVFLIKAKRLDYSFEPNVPFPLSEGNHQIFESGSSKVVSVAYTGSSTYSLVQTEGVYTPNADRTIWTNSIAPGNFFKYNGSKWIYNHDGWNGDQGEETPANSTSTLESGWWSITSWTITHPSGGESPADQLNSIPWTVSTEKKDNYDEYDIDQSSKDVFDMSSNDDVYGDYY